MMFSLLNNSYSLKYYFLNFKVDLTANMLTTQPLLDKSIFVQLIGMNDIHSCILIFCCFINIQGHQFPGI